MEHYEIAAYSTLRIWANRLPYHGVAWILEETLDEEERIDQRLIAIAEP